MPGASAGFRSGVSTRAKPRLVPDASHPITIARTAGRVTVTRGGHPVAGSTRALTLQEASYPPVQYLPLEDVDPEVLERSDRATYCPFKGDAGYFSVVIGEDRAENALWTYEQPYDAVTEIAGHVAFYPHLVEISVD
jgi:uncharacterized protein (DUF427 family)